MANIAFHAFKAASAAARIDIEAREDLRIVQTVGNAAASAGFHHADGVLDDAPYCAATDFSVRELNGTQIATWIEELCRYGFDGFYRNWPGNFHIHANFCGVPQKRQLDVQDEDFFAGRDGLVGHRKIDDEWWYPSVELRKIPEQMYRISNGPRGECCQAPIMTAATPPRIPPASLPLFFGDEQKPRLQLVLMDGVALAPARQFGTALGFDVAYDVPTRQVIYDGKEIPLPVKLIAASGYVPVRDLAREVGLKATYDQALFRVTVSH